MIGEKKYVELGAVIQCIKTEGADGDYNLGAKKDNEWFCAEVNRIPAADVEEVKHGCWVGIDDEPCEDFECDVCGSICCTCGNTWDLPNYCPNCGAKMDGGKNDEHRSKT